MGTIKLLDQNTINKIAAGEVVERPASAVKELVENSIDAGATAITVEIKEGGISLIRITDNGKGISKEDIKNAFLRHSTSKIDSVEDLLSVSSLGFRGEALASIASVAKVEVMTKTKEDLTGIRYVIEGGEEVSLEDVGCPNGTTILVRQLFYNTPVRRNFLKRPATEAGYVSELMNRLALSNPNTSFKFIYNNSVKLHTSGNNQLKDIIFNVYGKDIAKNLISVEWKEDNIEIKGFVGKPQISRANRNYENYYINGRFIKSNVIQRAIEDGYKTYLPIHKYPFTALQIKIDSELIDVNVHPTKMEIRFQNEDKVYEVINRVISSTLKGKELIPEVSIDNKKIDTNERIDIAKSKVPEQFEINRLNDINKVQSNTEKKVESEINISKPREIDSKKAIEASHKILSSIVNEQIKKDIVKEDKKNYSTNEKPVINEDSFLKRKNIDEQVKQQHPQKNENYNQLKTDKQLKIDQPIDNNQIEIEQKLLSKNSLPFYQIIGQLFNTYWIIEFKEKFYIIDQHAAHERVLYEKIMNDIKTSKVISQQLLQPLVVQVSIKEKQLIEEYQDVFKKVGFEIEEFGGDSYSVRAVPYIFNDNTKSDFFLELLDVIADDNYSKKHDLLIEKVAMLACKAAVKANKKMSVLETKKLIEQLLLLDNPYTCPHGRPTIISMTQYELEKKFKRIQ